MPATVLLLHGMARTPISLWPMERALAAEGFATSSIWYRSNVGRLAEIEARLVEDIPETGRVHMVGHSLGGLLALHLMSRVEPSRRGRIVQLGSPNLGSPLASKFNALELLLGPILRDLERGSTPDTRLDVAAIAGTAGPSALNAVSGLSGPNDGIVTVRSAFAAAPPSRRSTYPVLHSFMMMDGRVIRRTCRYLTEAETAADARTEHRPASA
ncbi:esterase/lipase family protein [Algicella marina]|uniref:Alpha/beta fold hydrolase n=1 Tax=Algicella marina TaxID=2683284 RepID=A0A6P1T590_9RHOB|nr:alpha/beta fold hydrolase [Algicella marina]QHQ35702.1 alpha/beta fold hydrolase [Algicella marina]